MTPVQNALWILLIPLISAGVIALLMRRRGAWAAGVSVTAAALAAALSANLILGGETVSASMEWLRLGEVSIRLGFQVDSLAMLMLAVVVGVGFLIHVFSLGYMREDPARARYFGGLSIFMFSMLGIVLADNLLMLFVFWELVGFSSWLLINHYHERPAAAAASKKAFIVNRVGDFGFLLGILWCYHAAGTVNLAELREFGGFGGAAATAIPLLLFCGAVGKSAQMPLHVWLPDAMEGPTPVSALIHAATMVAAGIYMLCRIDFLFYPSEAALNGVMWIGVTTAFYAAVCAVVQSDIKKILAYSTLSQLGYMTAAFGMGALESGGVLVAAGVGAAMFHLTTHAFFKALLFLGAGSVIHSCHHEQNIFKMGGLSRRMPVTFTAFTVGVAALIGFPFLAGFFSKDAILYLAWLRHPAAFGFLAFSAVLTAFYMTRLWRVVFFGPAKSSEAEHAHESGWIMTVPLVLLAVLAAAGGFIGLYPASFQEVLSLVPHANGSDHILILSVGSGAMVLGLIGGLLAYPAAAERDPLARRSPGLFALLASKLYFDEVYGFYVEKIQNRFASLLGFLEQIFLSGLIIRGLAGLAGLAGIGARALHVGNLHAYVYWFLLGILLLGAFAAGIF